MPTINVGDNVTAIVNANGAGTTYTFASGTHRITSSINAKNNDIFTGASGATISGSVLLSGWTTSGSNYYTSAGSQWPETQDFENHCADGSTDCTFPIDLYYTTTSGSTTTVTWMRRVYSTGALAAGKWYLDKTFNPYRVWVRDNPAGITVELAVAPHAISYDTNVYTNVTGVTIQNLKLEKYACGLQSGVIEKPGRTTGNWLVQDCEIAYSHGTGIRAHSGMRVLRNNIHHHQQIGLVGGDIQNDDTPGSPLLIDGNTITNCNPLNLYQVGHEAGATKITNSKACVFRNNTITDNIGPGIWFDIDNFLVDCYSNTVERCYQGIFHEISQSAHYYNNTIRTCGLNPPGEYYPNYAGIIISASHDVEVNNNLIIDCVNGIMMQQQNRPELQPPSPQHPNYGQPNDHRCYSNNIHDNTIVSANSCISGIDYDNGDDTIISQGGTLQGNNHYENNHYYIGSGAAGNVYWHWGRLGSAGQNWGAWHTLGNDDVGTPSYLAYSAYNVVAPPTTTGVITDTFSGGNSTGLGANWVFPDVAGNWNVVGGQATSAGVSADNLAAFAGASWTGGANQYSEVVMVSEGASDGGPAVRVSTTLETAYILSVRGLGTLTSHQIQRAVAGTYAVILAFDALITANQVVRLQISGVTLTAYAGNDEASLVAISPSVDDASITSGKPGMYAYSNQMVIDNFAAGVVGAATSAVPILVTYYRRRAA